MLEKEMITDPVRWQLILEVADDALQVVIFSPYAQHAMIYERIELGEPGKTPLQRLENVIYDNPLLLSDFGAVTALIDTQRFLPIPDILAEMGQECVEATFRRAIPGTGTGTSVMVSPLSAMPMAVAFEVNNDVMNFLRRTFPGVKICHTTVPVCNYFRAKNRLRGYGKMMVNLGHGRLDVVVLGESAPLLVNSYRFREPMDAVYYIMAVRQKLSLAETDEIIVGGDRMLRAQVTPVLRRYVRYVMPAIFPTVMFQAGRASLVAPFEMVLAPITAEPSHHAAANVEN